MHSTVHCTSLLRSGCCCSEDTSFSSEDGGRWREMAEFSHQGKSLYLYAFQVLPVIVWCTKSHKFSGLKRNGRCIVFALDTVTLSSIFCNYKEWDVDWFVWMYMKPYSHPSVLFSVLLFDTVNTAHTTVEMSWHIWYCLRKTMTSSL